MRGLAQERIDEAARRQKKCPIPYILFFIYFFKILKLPHQKAAAGMLCGVPEEPVLLWGFSSCRSLSWSSGLPKKKFLEHSSLFLEIKALTRRNPPRI